MNTISKSKLDFYNKQQATIYYFSNEQNHFESIEPTLHKIKPTNINPNTQKSLPKAQVASELNLLKLYSSHKTGNIVAIISNRWNGHNFHDSIPIPP